MSDLFLDLLDGLDDVATMVGNEEVHNDIMNYKNGTNGSLNEDSSEDSITIPEDIEIGASYETISGYITRESENKYKVFDEDGMYVDWADNFEDAYELSMSIYDIGEEDPYWEEQREKDKEEYANGDSWDEDDESDYTFLRRKTVTDSDGFTTDYAWYVSPNGTNVFVFGDMDYYRPEDGNFDFETESNKEAKEWFDNYKGPGEEEDDVDLDFDESLTEASYGGAFDIADDQFFTREELDEFGYEIADKLTARFNKPFEYNGAFIEDGNRLEVDVMNDEFGEFTGKATIDMRKIKKPSDLNKYQIYIMDDITNQVSDVMKDFYGESFTEDVERNADWDNGLWYDEKEGCLMASKDVFDDWEDSQSLKESSEDGEAWDYETSEKELKVFTNNWTIDKGSFNVTFEKEKEDMSDILKKHGYQVEVSGDDRRTPIEYHFEFYKVIDESLRDVMVAIGNKAKQFGKKLYDNTVIGTVVDDVKKVAKDFNAEVDKAKKERYKQNIDRIRIGALKVDGKETVFSDDSGSDFRKFVKEHNLSYMNYPGKTWLEKQQAAVSDILEGKIKRIALVNTRKDRFDYLDLDKLKIFETVDKLSKDFLLGELKKLDAVDKAADQLEGNSNQDSNKGELDIEEE